MSIDVAELLVKAKASEAVVDKGPDPAVDPDGALRYHRSLWPLNQKVADGDLPEIPAGSDRVRLRRAADELAECGLAMEGNFSQGYNPRANLNASCSFSGDGTLWSRRVSVSLADPGPMDEKDALSLAQKILHHWGFAMVASMDGTLILSNAGDETSVIWDETGLRSPYGGTPGCSPAQMLRYGAVLDDFAGYGISDWATSSYSPEQALEWCKVGVRSVREAKEWQMIGLSSKKAGEWVLAGIPFYQARDWIREGYSPADAKGWNDLTRSCSMSMEWITAGYTLGQTRMWMRFASKPEEIKFLEDEGVDENQLNRLYAAGCNHHTMSALRGWVGRYKITLAEALQWAELGNDFVGPGKRGRWHKAGFTAEEVGEWQKALGTPHITLEQVKSKIAAGFDPKQGVEWSSVHSGFSDAGMVETWTEAGLKPQDAKPWVSVSREFCDYDLVADWIDKGLTPKDAKPWVQAHRAFANREVVDDWIEACPELADKPKVAARLYEIQDTEKLRLTIQLLKEAGV